MAERTPPQARSNGDSAGAGGIPEPGWEAISAEAVARATLADQFGIIIPPRRQTMVDERILTAYQIGEWDPPAVATMPFLGRDGLIIEGGTNLLYSFPKVGKTEILASLATEWTEAGLNVLYLSEEGFGNWKKRLVLYDCYSEALRIWYAWGSNIAEVLDTLDNETYDVLVVDTIRYTIGYRESEGDKDVDRVIVPLFRAAAGKTVVCSYHARKMPGDGGRDISGHHALYAAFDRAMQLVPIEGRDDQRKVTVSGRCLYDGDVTVAYQQLEPGRFELLDAAALVEEKDHQLQCLGCGEWFNHHRKTTQFCSRTCRQRSRRHDGNVSGVSHAASRNSESCESRIPSRDSHDSVEIPLWVDPDE